MSKDEVNKINYVIAFISEFSKEHHLSAQQGYEYLHAYKGLDFVDEFYDVEHTLSFDDAVEDVTNYCRRMGGQL